jgi:SAM-dependent methyltransferase
MQYRDLAEMYAVETDHWWFAGKRLLFKRLLAGRLAYPGLRILDIGCGTGAAAVDFGAHGRLCACDRSTDALSFARSRGVRSVVASDAVSLPFADASFDLVLAFDVIEHVSDDLGMVRELKRVLRPRGAIAIHVPAWPSLWSRHDEVLEHKRRYTRRGLRRLLLDADLHAEYLAWASAAILPPAFLLRSAHRLGFGGSDDAAASEESAQLYPLPRPLNAAMLSVYRLEALLAATTGLPFGLSLAAVAAR